MRSPAVPRRPAARRLMMAVDVVTLRPGAGTLELLVVAAGGAGRERWVLPWGAPRDGEGLDESARRIAQEQLGRAPAFVAQAGALGDDRRHPGEAALSVGYLALVPLGTGDDLAGDGRWVSLDDVPALAPRQRAVVTAAIDALRQRLGDEPVAFRLLPPLFTLTELQGVYELILGRALHKASFRRALQGAFLVDPTDEWRSEGRGRPAQLFRYAPRRGRGGRPAVRFDFGR